MRPAQVLVRMEGVRPGRMMIAIAKRAGVKTINVVRRSAQKEELLALGCAACFTSRACFQLCVHLGW